MTPSEQQLNELLGFTAEALDISDELDQRLTESYRDLGAWFKQDNESRFTADSEVYPQGSRLLGTLTAPIKPGYECDVDLVYRRDIQRTSITQQELKETAGQQLAEYVSGRAERGLLLPRVEEKTRCWTLHYPDFHLDVLPALPDDEPSAGTEAIILTDRSLRRWQSSNPRAYARWFRSRMAIVLTERRAAMAKEAAVRIVDIPEESVKTPLQRAVQLLKRHRDLAYDGAQEDKPISIIITTLAAQAYQNEPSVYVALHSMVERMGDFIERRNGVHWVANPVNPAENFADKWQAYPERGRCFLEWLQIVQGDLEAAVALPGIDKVAAALSKGWGRTTAESAVRRYGTRMLSQRQAGVLRAAPKTATLGTTGTVVPKHTFFGGDED